VSGEILIGTSPVTRYLESEISDAARSDAKVLLTGESGVGKEVVAKMIHQQSRRRNVKLVALNCAAVPDSLLESELFGHVRGSFTGAYRDKPGLLELANNGTIFLDEIGETSLRMQALMLRFLENGEIWRIGADRVQATTDVRVIAATNRDLADQIAQREFRADLYYRLNVLHIKIPPLRERRDDIPQFLDHFFKIYAQRHVTAVPELTPAARAALIAYDWPGNVRELKNVIERAVILSRGKVLRLDLAMSDILNAPAAAPPEIEEQKNELMTESDVRELERRNTMLALTMAQGRVSGPSGAAKLLGIKPTTLADRIKKLKLGRAGARGTG
jgi:transcriptional regulator with PAS, ATPase and Fis domain